MPMTERYAARALVAQKAKELHDAIFSLLPHLTYATEAHKLAEICAECAWCEREYGEAER